ncbi:MAG: efflux RND transporter periplasmic adaptor subunit [Pseudomonadota bacterium]
MTEATSKQDYEPDATGQPAVSAHSSPKQHWFARLTRRAVTVTVTATVFVVAGGLIVGGSGILADRADAVVGPDPAPVPTVRAMTIRPQDSYTVTRTFQGQVEPAQTVQLGFQQPGEIDRIAVDEGDRVQAGDLLASLDTRILDAERARLEASRRALEAQVELAALTTDRQSELRERGFASQSQLDTARLGLADLEARIAEVDAALVRIDVQLSQTELVAPFDGVIATRTADSGTVVGVGQAVLELLEASEPVFRVGIDPTLANDDAFASASIQIGGRTFDATFDSFRPDLDPQTRTRTALFSLKTDEPVYRQAGTLTLSVTVDQRGYLVPLAAVQDGVRGLWTLLSLNPTDGEADRFTVGLEAVELLHLEGETAFVAGTLNGETKIVADGTHRVVPGETVLISGAVRSTPVNGEAR